MTDSVSEQIDPGDLPPGIPLARPVEWPAWSSAADPLLLADETRRAVWADIGLFVICLIVVESLMVGALKAFVLPRLGVPEDSVEPLPDSVRQTLLLPTITLRAAGLITSVLVISRYRRQSVRSVGLRTSKIAVDVPLGLAAVVVAYGLIALTMFTLWWVWPDVSREMEENARRIMGFVPRLKPWQFLPFAGLIGVYEELVFRGFLMPRVRRALGGWTWAVLITTFLFTGLHAIEQTRAALVIVLVLSLLFSGLTVWRRSIVPAVVAHAVFDLSQFLLLSWAAGEDWK